MNWNVFLNALPIAALVVASWLYTWLHTELPVHVFQVIRALGWHRDDPDFWMMDTDLSTWTRKDWEQWMLVRFSEVCEPWTALLSELLLCRNCLSWHLSFWTATLFVILGLIPWWLHPILWMATPYVSLFMVRVLENQS